ncbi:MAG: tetratricopeptide repeat protein [Candidatus Marinimicrobia bacterium]|nr:tetratricopeptide repeat protein [Candidatus Neomarinimicrobiota bacterium]
MSDLSALARLHFELGATYTKDGQYKLAIDAFKFALREHPAFLSTR